jgi:Holliday junction resolvase YEN1
MVGPPARLFKHKLTFSPFDITSLKQKDFNGDRAGYWNGDVMTPFDPDHRVEWEMPDY